MLPFCYDFSGWLSRNWQEPSQHKEKPAEALTSFRRIASPLPPAVLQSVSVCRAVNKYMEKPYQFVL
jgi:hypothetical protein